MKMTKPYVCLLAVALVGALAGCSTGLTKTADVTPGIRASMDQAGLKDVTVSQDRDKGVVTLGGHVMADEDKGKAESIARSLSGSQVVANQIAVLPPGVEDLAHKVNVDLDKGIESNLDAALIASELKDGVTYNVKNHVVTLTGNVDSQAKRKRAQDVAASVVNVEQVVNELQVKRQKATSSN